MRLSKSWVIATKDFKVFLKQKKILYSITVAPIVVSILIPTVISFAGQNKGGHGVPATELTVLLPAFAFFYLILAGYIPTTIASYSIVGRKVEKSLERLLASPTTDSEILLGKGISAFLPSIGAIFGGSVIFMVLMDLVTQPKLGYYYFPNWNTWLVLAGSPHGGDERRMERNRLVKGDRRPSCSTDRNSTDTSPSGNLRRRRTQPDSTRRH